MTRGRFLSDRIYYSGLDATAGRPYAVYVHGNSRHDRRGLRSRDHRHRAEVEALVGAAAIVGEVEAAAREARWELVATFAAYQGQGGR